MKAKIKATGEIINIASYAEITLDKCDSYGTPIGMKTLWQIGLGVKQIKDVI